LRQRLLLRGQLGLLLLKVSRRLRLLRSGLLLLGLRLILLILAVVNRACRPRNDSSRCGHAHQRRASSSHHHFVFLLNV
jgi:hypothetical protein